MSAYINLDPARPGSILGHSDGSGRIRPRSAVAAPTATVYQTGAGS